MTSRVLGQNRYGLWIAAAVLVACLACWTDRTDAAFNYNWYPMTLTTEGQVWERSMVTGWWGDMSMGPAVRTVPPAELTQVAPPTTMVLPSLMSISCRHEQFFMPQPGTMFVEGNTRDALMWAGTGWWNVSMIEY